MKLPNVTEFPCAHLLERCVIAAAATLVLALGSPVFALQPNGDSSQVVVNPLQSTDASGPELVPPAPEASEREQLVAIQAEDPFAASPEDEADAAAHGIEIIPAATSSAVVKGRSYEDVYRSIPYNYTEYLANPGYRHDAAMEILFGELRPTTIVRQYEPQVIQNLPPMEYQPYRWSHSERWQYRAPDFRLLDPGCCQ